jgi:PIN domain
MNHKAIVLDANILIRAVLGKRVRALIVENLATVKFFAPDVAYEDARKYLPALLEKRGVKSAPAMAVLETFEAIVRPLEFDFYAGLQQQALQRIAVPLHRRQEKAPLWTMYSIKSRCQSFNTTNA